MKRAPPSDRRFFFGVGDRSAASARALAREFASRMGNSRADLLFPLFPPPPIAKYVIGGSNLAGTAGQILYSNDGNTWNAATGVPVTFRPQAFVGTGTMWVAVGTSLAGGTTTISLTSTNGAAWTQQTFPTPYGAVGVAWNGTNFVAGDVITGSRIFSSPDGVTWTPHTVTIFGARPSYAVWTGTQFIVDSGSFDVWTSPDGITWGHNINRLSASPGGAAWSGFMFADGDQGNISPLMQYTADGTTWGFFNTSGNNGVTRAIASNGSIFCAIGDGLYTAPGNTATPWTNRAMPAGAPYRGITWDGSRFLAVGTSIIAKAPDGINFVTSVLPDGVWGAIAYHA